VGYAPDVATLPASITALPLFAHRRLKMSVLHIDQLHDVSLILINMHYRNIPEIILIQKDASTSDLT
jgi:hypothetical protein